MRTVLGLDIGTTGTKAMLFREDGQLMGHAYRPYPTANPHVAWSEQNPEDWWQAVTETVREIAVGSPVAAISLSLQGGTIGAFDAAFRPLRPAIVWNDGRCVREREAFLAEVGPAESMYQRSGWKLGNGLPACALRWVRDHEPEVFQKAAWFLSVPDYIAARMTGIPAADISDVGINQLADIRAFAYDAALLRFAGVSERQLPKILPSGAIIGPLTSEAAEALGLSTDTLLIAGAHDQYAVALGAGLTEAGDMLIGSGTSWVVTAIGDRPDFESGLSQSVAAAPGKWGSLLSLSSGGVCLEWWRKQVGTLAYEEINREAAARRAAEDGLFFFPFSGQTTEGVRFEKASFTGLDLAHDRFHITRAVLEGVAFQIAWMAEQFASRPMATHFKLAGGAAKSPLWPALVADITGLPVRIPEVADLACVGAAILAGVGAGVFRDATEGYARLAVGERTLEPDPDRMARYQALFADYKRQARALGALYGLA